MRLKSRPGFRFRFLRADLLAKAQSKPNLSDLGTNKITHQSNPQAKSGFLLKWDQFRQSHACAGRTVIAMRSANPPPQGAVREQLAATY